MYKFGSIIGIYLKETLGGRVAVGVDEAKYKTHDDVFGSEVGGLVSEIDGKIAAVDEMADIVCAGGRVLG